MSDSPRLPARSVVVALFVVAACAVLAAGGLTAVVLADDRPRPTVQASAGRPSPSAREDTSRALGPPLCLVGSWRTVDERLMIKFYNNEDPIPFTVSGRAYDFRPDGTGTERMDNVVFTGTFQGNQLRLVGNGFSEFTWTATDKVITYGNRTRSEASFSYYDQRGFLETQPLPGDRPMNEVNDYACQGTQLVESNAGLGFQSAWVRTAASGVYG
ncbi:jacalin family lectin [Saccharothrix stipae]